MRQRILPRFDHIEAERYSPIGSLPIVVLDLHEPGAAVRARELADRSLAVVLGYDRPGTCPPIDATAFDLLLTTGPAAQKPWVSVPIARLDARIEGLRHAVTACPISSASLCQLLRAIDFLPFSHALTTESMAYSMLLGGSEFARWRSENPAAAPAAVQGPLVDVSRLLDHVTLTLSQPRRRNAFCAAMRDALFDALAALLDDPTRPTALLRAHGSCFSTGGDLAEFGSARDLASAHIVRSLRSCALLIDRLGERMEVAVHGACIGSGLEIPAAARTLRVIGSAYFQLPEIHMGLIPGAGGTATISRRIGRHRTGFMALSGLRITAATALEWGLVDAIEPVP